MRTQPIQPAPSFTLNTTRTLKFIAPDIKQKADTVRFANGKKLLILSEYKRNILQNKLYYLKDRTGEWIKSKLKYYKDGKFIKTITSSPEH